MNDVINNVAALQGLYVALGGDIADVENITTTAEMLYALADVAQAAASELPAVKSSDNGKLLKVVGGKWAKAASDLPAVTGDDNDKVLTVVNGAWDKAAASGGGNEPFIVNLVSTPDKTNAEIYEAFQAGRPIYAMTTWGMATLSSVDANKAIFIGCFVFSASDNQPLIYVYEYEDDNITSVAGTVDLTAQS